MNNLAFELPLNNLSFGQVSNLILRTIYEQEKCDGQKYEISLFPIGQVDLGSQINDNNFNEWVKSKIKYGIEKHSIDTPIFKLWHLSGGTQRYSSHQTLLSFYELDEPTEAELNAARNNKTLFSSQYSCDIFKSNGIDAQFLPLGFDSFNFKQKLKKHHSDERIVFNLCGKFEKRKGHEKIIKSWIKKYGNNQKYALQCAIYNPFLGRTQEECNANNQNAAAQIVNGKKPFNLGFYPLMRENMVYNEFLNSADVILGMSNAEGWGLPEFQSVALGKHSIILDAHGYKGWANSENSVLVKPNGKEPAYDGLFFQKGQPYNQGNIFTWDEEEFLAACDSAIARVEKSRVNNAGLSLQTDFSKEKFIESICKITQD